MSQATDTVPDRRRPTCYVVLEQTLGHVTHAQNLRRLLPSDDLELQFLPIDFEPSTRWRSIPGHQNWTIRAGLRAKAAIRSARRDGHDRPDVMFVHTQVPAVLLGREMRSVPTVVSLDATPVQYDSLGEHYDHGVGPGWIESLKTRMNRRCFERAEHLVAWARWTKESLAADYGIDPGKVTVIPPGVHVERWQAPVGHERHDDGITRILFVGGDLERKGGRELIEAFALLRNRHGDRIELHLVTPAALDAPPGVTVHRTMTPNSAELIALYHRCDVFCLPTRGDCLPMVLPEAGAAGLALVSTDVGAIGEVVRDGETGLLVPVSDVAALVEALERVIDDPALRRRLGAGANDLVRAEHDAALNAARVAATIASVLEARS